MENLEQLCEQDKIFPSLNYLRQVSCATSEKLVVSEPTKEEYLLNLFKRVLKGLEKEILQFFLLCLVHLFVKDPNQRVFWLIFQKMSLIYTFR